jgi:hypothetical protein
VVEQRRQGYSGSVLRVAAIVRGAAYHIHNNAGVRSVHPADGPNALHHRAGTCEQVYPERGFNTGTESIYPVPVRWDVRCYNRIPGL